MGVSGLRDHRVKISVAHKLPQRGIDKPEKAPHSRVSCAVWKLYPRIPVKQRHIPFDLDSKTRVDFPRHALHAAIRDLQIDRRLRSQLAEDRRQILDRMGRYVEDAEPAAFR